ncbi:MAG: DNA polymerase IV [Bdellovibrionales bacterium]|nr:DNA polymerase IV [Bdellovibrionales bacterium]
MDSVAQSPAQKKIIHVDMDAFYASVEKLDRPELLSKPVIVGGSPENRGVVASCCYLARRFGVRSAIPSRRALQLCPQAIFISPRFGRYREISQQIREIFYEVTDQVEPLSLDEAYLDVTQNKQNEPLAGKLAHWLRSEIRARTGLTASAGVGPNKLIAKIASDLKKPDGLVIIPPDKVLGVLGPLSVDRLWGVGPRTAERLNRMGYLKVSDLRDSSIQRLEAEFGRWGSELWDQAHGRDDREVISHWEPKSCGSETTFNEDILNSGRLFAVIDQLAEEVADELEKIQRPGRTVTLKIRYSNFETITRSETLFRPTGRYSVISRIARELLFKNTEVGFRPVRLLGVSMTGLLSSEDGPEQLWLDLDLD